MESETIKDLVSDFIRNTKDKYFDDFSLKSKEYFRVVPLTTDNLQEYITGKENKGKILKYDVLVDWLESRNDNTLLPNISFTEEDIKRYGFSENEKLMFQEIYTNMTHIKVDKGNGNVNSTQYKTSNGKFVDRLSLDKYIINRGNYLISLQDNDLFKSYYEYTVECKKEIVDAKEIEDKKKNFKEKLLIGMITKALNFSEKGKYSKEFENFQEPDYQDSKNNYENFPNISRKNNKSLYEKAFKDIEVEDVKVLVSNLFSDKTDIIKSKGDKYFFKGDNPSTKITDFNLYLDRIVSDKSNIRIKFSHNGEVIERITVDWKSINEMTEMYYSKPTDYSVNSTFYIMIFSAIIILSLILIFYGIYKYPDNQKTTLSLVMSGVFLLLLSIFIMYLDLRNLSDNQSSIITKYTLWISIITGTFTAFIMFSVGFGLNRGNDEKINSSSNMSRNNFYLEAFLVSLLMFISSLSIGLLAIFGKTGSNKNFLYIGTIICIMSISFFVYLIDRSIRQASPINIIGALVSLVFLGLGIYFAGTNLPDSLSLNGKKNINTQKVKFFINILLIFFAIFSLSIIGYSFTKSESESEKIFLSIFGSLSLITIGFVIFRAVKGNYDIGKLSYPALLNMNLPNKYKDTVIYMIIDKVISNDNTIPNPNELKDNLYKIYLIFRQGNYGIDFNNLELLFDKIISNNNSIEFFFNDYSDYFSKILKEVQNKTPGDSSLSQLNQNILKFFSELEKLDNESKHYLYQKIKYQGYITRVKKIIQSNYDINGQINVINNITGKSSQDPDKVIEEAKTYKTTLQISNDIYTKYSANNIFKLKENYNDIEAYLSPLMEPSAKSIYRRKTKDTKTSNEYYFFLVSYLSQIINKYGNIPELSLSKRYIIYFSNNFKVSNTQQPSYQSLYDQNDLFLNELNSSADYNTVLKKYLNPNNPNNLIDEINSNSKNLDLLTDQSENFKINAGRLFILFEDLESKSTIYQEIVDDYPIESFKEILEILNKYYKPINKEIINILIDNDDITKLTDLLTKLGTRISKRIPNVLLNITTLEQSIKIIDNSEIEINNLKFLDIADFANDTLRLDSYLKNIENKLTESIAFYERIKNIKNIKLSNTLITIRNFTTKISNINLTDFDHYLNTNYLNMNEILRKTQDINTNLNLVDLKKIDSYKIYLQTLDSTTNNYKGNKTLSFIEQIINYKNKLLQNEYIKLSDYFEILIIEKMIYSLELYI